MEHGIIYFDFEQQLGTDTTERLTEKDRLASYAGRLAMFAPASIDAGARGKVDGNDL